MLKKNRLFTPGPTPLLPQAQTAMASLWRAPIAPPISAPSLRAFSPTSRNSSHQERRARSLLVGHRIHGSFDLEPDFSRRPGVLVLTAGKFGERWTALAKAFGCAVETVTAPYGETISLEEVRRKLTSELRCVYVQATESSTGARHDVEGIAKLVRALPDTLFVVDAITGLGTTHLTWTLGELTSSSEARRRR